MYIEVKATDAQGGLFKSKAAMGRALAADVKSVRFTAVGDVVGNDFAGTADEIPPGAKLTVVGPDPFVSRNWYGTVEFSGGQVKLDGKAPKPGTAPAPKTAKPTDAERDERRAQAAIVKAAVVRAIFCPFTGDVLDMRRAVVVDTGTKLFVCTGTHWDTVKDDIYSAMAGLGKEIKVYDGRELYTPAGRVR